MPTFKSEQRKLEVEEKAWEIYSWAWKHKKTHAFFTRPIAGIGYSNIERDALSLLKEWGHLAVKKNSNYAAKYTVLGDRKIARTKLFEVVENRSQTDPDQIIPPSPWYKGATVYRVPKWALYSENPREHAIGEVRQYAA